MSNEIQGLDIARDTLIELITKSRIGYWVGGIVGVLAAITGLDSQVIYGAALVILLDFISGVLVAIKKKDFSTDNNALGRSFWKVVGYLTCLGLIVAAGLGEKSLLGTEVIGSIGFPALMGMIFFRDGMSILENTILLVGEDRIPAVLKEIVSRFRVYEGKNDKPTN